MGDLPAIGDLVTLRDKGDVYYSSRVEDLADHNVTVARPADLRAALSYDIGLELDLIWTLSTGIHVLPTTLVDMSVDRHIRLWHLAVTGDVRTEQRRDYVRVALTGVVTIRADDTARDETRQWPLGPLAATFVDLSEVALQAAVTPPADAPEIREQTDVRCQFTLGGFDYDLAGTVVIVRPGVGLREQRVVVRFDTSKAVGDALRKEVFSIQLAQRRNK